MKNRVRLQLGGLDLVSATNSFHKIVVKVLPDQLGTGIQNSYPHNQITHLTKMT